MTVAASDHSPRTTAPTTAIAIRTWMSRVRALSDITARRAGYTPPVSTDATNAAIEIAGASSSQLEARPVARHAPDATRRRCRTKDGSTTCGCSCSSHARMPVSATASLIAEADSRAASYVTSSRRPSTSADIASTPVRCFRRRSRMATSSWQSIPSILKTDSAWTSQTGQAPATVALIARPLRANDATRASLLPRAPIPAQTAAGCARRRAHRTPCGLHGAIGRA